MKDNRFTDKQIADFRSYKKVQMTGMFNMFDPNARMLSGLSKEDYIFVMENYNELKQQEEEN